MRDNPVVLDTTVDSDEGTLRYSVVIPVYKNAASIPQLIAALTSLNEQLGNDMEAVFVVDGSPDESATLLLDLVPKAPFSSQVLLHSRNFGAFAAIRSGFLSARGEYVAAMAADLQEPIDLVRDFFTELSTGNWDVAVGQRISRDDPAVSKLLSRSYWSMYRRWIQPEMPAGGVDVFACTRDVAEKFGHLEESHSSLIGLLFWLGYRRVEVPYTRVAREHGKSSWSMKKKLKYLSDSVFSFTSLPISIILSVGTVGAAAALIYAIATLISWLTGAIPVPGYTALMIVTLFSTSSILVALGIVGTYVWRAYENTKKRPQSVVMRHEKFDA